MRSRKNIEQTNGDPICGTVVMETWCSRYVRISSESRTIERQKIDVTDAMLSLFRFCVAGLLLKVSCTIFTTFSKSSVSRNRYNFKCTCSVCISKQRVRFWGISCGLFANESPIASTGLCKKRLFGVHNNIIVKFV